MASLFVQALRVHQWVYEHSGGLIGHRVLFGNPTGLLRVTGRRTGAERTHALTYGRDGDRWLVVASNGGARRPPLWLLNLESHPDCEFQVGRRRHPVTARPTYPDDPEYARRFELMDRINSGRYAGYRRKTTRELAIVELTPR